MSERAHEGRASGKVILFGEHAVVYGVPGLAAGIERGARATAERTGSAHGSLRIGGKAHDPESDLGRALASLLAVEPALPAMDVEAFAEIPPGGGLGCSAALGVAIARACESAAGDQAPSPSLVYERGLAWERVFHGNPSGIDTAAAALGTFLWFERGPGPKALTIPVDVWLAVGYSGSSSSTKTMVEGLARLKERKPEIVQKFLDGVTAIVKNAKLALDAGDERAVGQLMDMNQMLLAGVMMSTESIERMCSIARKAGALGAKLTGSGGGGSVIALGGIAPPGAASSPAEQRARTIAEAFTAEGYAAFATRIAGHSA